MFNNIKFQNAVELYQDEKDLDSIKLLHEIIEENKTEKNLSEVYLLLGQIHLSPSKKKYKDVKKGIEFLEKSVQLGCGEAARELANLYYFGDDTKVDFLKSEKYWQLGMKLGDSISGLELLNLYFDENFDNNEDKLKVIDWLIKNGDFKGSALFKMSKLYMTKNNELYDPNIRKHC